MTNHNTLTFPVAVLLCLVVMLVTFSCAILLTLAIPDISLGTVAWMNIPGFFAGILLGIKLTGIPASYLFRIKRFSIDMLMGTLFGSFGLILVMAEVDNYILYYLPMPLEMIDLFKTLISGSSGFFVVVIMAPVTEELFFRGMILKGLGLKYKPAMTICISAFLFGAIHFNPWQLIPAFGAGIFIGWLYLVTNNILLCIFVHALNNGLGYIMEILNINIQGLAYDIEKGVQFQPHWVTFSGAALLGIGTFMLNKSKTNVI